MTSSKCWKKEKKILNTTKLVFKNEGEIKMYPDKQISRDFVSSRLILEEILKETLQGE